MAKKDLIFIGLAGVNLLLWLSILFISHFYTSDPIKANILIQFVPAFGMFMLGFSVAKGNELPSTLLGAVKISLVAAFIGMIVLITKFVMIGN